MSAIGQVGTSTQYSLGFHNDAIPTSLMSNKSARPIPSTVTTVVLPSLSTSQGLGGTSILQLPCSSVSGAVSSAYLRWTVKFTRPAGSAASTWRFGGPSSVATSCIQRLSTFVNSQAVDQITNAAQLYDALFSHASSNDFVNKDLQILAGANTTFTIALNATDTDEITVCVPIIGMLSSTQAFPSMLVNGNVQVEIQWGSVLGSMVYTPGTAFTSATFSNVALIYERLQPEGSFVDSIRSQMQQGNKFVYSYTNYSSTSVPIAAGTPSQTVNYGLNLSSLRSVFGVIVQDSVAASQSDIDASVNRALTQFQVALDGRYISMVPLNSVTMPALVFAECQRSFSKLFDYTCTDVSGAPVVNAAGLGGTYLTSYFCVGSSCLRTVENLAFAGSPCSNCSINMQFGNDANPHTMYLYFVSDMNLLIGADGAIEIVR